MGSEHAHLLLCMCKQAVFFLFPFSLESSFSFHRPIFNTFIFQWNLVFHEILFYYFVAQN